MDQDHSYIIYDGVVVPGSALLRRKRRSKYGSVPDLDDEELADPGELERLAYIQEFAPVLALPVQSKSSGIRPDIDENGGVDWGAFGTVDFERTRPAFDKARYKADKLREELRDVLILLSIVQERLPRKAKYLVLKYLRLGIIELEHIASEDMIAVARMERRARRLQQGIRELGGRGMTRAELLEVLR